MGWKLSIEEYSLKVHIHMYIAVDDISLKWLKVGFIVSGYHILHAL